jgi:hypothetical protein
MDSDFMPLTVTSSGWTTLNGSQAVDARCAAQLGDFATGDAILTLVKVQGIITNTP